MLINVPVSIGELFDKISILDIKTKKIKNKDDLKFTLSQAYGFVIGEEDSVSIGYGTCDKF